jgi:hypothetical protein
LCEAMYAKQAENLDSDLSYAEVRVNLGVGLIMCLTEAQKAKVWQLMVELGFGPYINQPEPVRAAAAAAGSGWKPVQFMRPFNWRDTLDKFMRMLLDHNGLEHHFQLICEVPQSFRGMEGSSVTVLLSERVLSRIMSNDYKLRGICGDVTFFGREVKAVKNDRRAAAEAEAKALKDEQHRREQEKLDAEAMDEGDRGSHRSQEGNSATAVNDNGDPEAGDDGNNDVSDKYGKRGRTPSTSSNEQEAEHIRQKKKSARLASDGANGPMEGNDANTGDEAKAADAIQGTEPKKSNWADEHEMQ